MHKPLLALALALLAPPAPADTLITNVNGVQVDARGQLQHFSGLLEGAGLFHRQPRLKD